MTDLPANYDIAAVEALLLEIAAELHPENLKAKDLLLRVIRDPKDAREVDVATQAITGLHEYGLFSVREEGVVVPTAAALRAVALLA